MASTPYEFIYRGDLQYIGDFNSQLYFDVPADGTLTAIAIRAASVSGFSGNWYIGLTQNGTDILTGANRPQLTAIDLSPEVTGLSISLTKGDVLIPTVDARGAGVINGPITVILYIDAGGPSGTEIGSGASIVRTNSVVAGITDMGDPDSNGNGTLLEIDDSTGDIFANGIGDFDVSGHVALRIPYNAISPANSNGEIGIHTGITDFLRGILKYFSGAEMAVVAMPATQLVSPVDGKVVTYNATTDQFELQTPSGGGGSGTVTHTGGALTSNSVVLGAGTDDTKVVAGIVSDGTSKVSLGEAGTSVGKLGLKNATSGEITLQPPTGALGTATITVPAATDTLVGKATTDTLTNKSISGSTNTLSALPASGISGVIPIANLATGTPSGSKFIRDDGTLQVPAGGSGSVATDTIFDAKGDLAVGTGSDTAAKLTVGSNGLFLKADSTQTTGLTWAAASGGGGTSLGLVNAIAQGTFLN